MKKAILTFLVGLLGTAGGAYIGWNMAKKKYEHLADDEVKSVKKALTDYYEKLIPQTVTSDSKKVVEKKPLINRQLDVADDKYKDYSAPYRNDAVGERIPGKPELNKLDVKEKKVDGLPYVISPEEFNDSNFETKTLMYYADHVLADDDYNIINDVVGEIGPDALSQFGLYEEDCIHVRNDGLGIDYEILLDQRFFYKIAPRKTVPVTGGNQS